MQLIELVSRISACGRSWHRRHQGTLSGGELAFAIISKVVVNYDRSLGWAEIEELRRLLRC
ncbi:hypothetical protein [Paraburkholderia sp. 40]|uniref:hypothetical protein n=1 Tax=unclassified Paraburkholderia TaxID=2615204 RepID=UPI003D24E84E